MAWSLGLSLRLSVGGVTLLYVKVGTDEDFTEL